MAARHDPTRRFRALCEEVRSYDWSKAGKAGRSESRRDRPRFAFSLWRRPALLWMAGAAASTALLFVVGYGTIVRPLQDRVSDFRREDDALRGENTRLQADVDALKQKQSAPPPVNAPTQPSPKSESPSLSDADWKTLHAQITTLHTSPGKERGLPSERPALHLLSPVGKVVLTDRPTLSWSPITGAASYQLTLTEFPPTASPLPAVTTTAPAWTEKTALARGRRYAWSVEAYNGQGQKIAETPASEEALFLILDAESARRVALAQRRDADQPLKLGVIELKAGLLDEAEREFNKAKTTAQKLLKQAQDLRRPTP